MIQLLMTYKYIILIPLSVIEGPIVTIVCGFLVTTGVFNPLFVYLVMVIGDIAGDAGIYFIGYKGKRLLKYVRVTDEKLERSKQYFADNRKKALFASKLAHGVGFTGLIAAGASHLPYKKYFITCGIISVVQSAVMLIIGILFGHAYVQIGKYLNYYAAIVSITVLFIVVFIFIRKYKNNLSEK
jgi:membrane protein DedA with SNARE-associated domain